MKHKENKKNPQSSKSRKPYSEKFQSLTQAFSWKIVCGDYKEAITRYYSTCGSNVLHL